MNSADVKNAAFHILYGSGYDTVYLCLKLSANMTTAIQKWYELLLDQHQQINHLKLITYLSYGFLFPELNMTVVTITQSECYVI